jgi:tetratricopeptide (TPR) repeat protein
MGNDTPDIYGIDSGLEFREIGATLTAIARDYPGLFSAIGATPTRRPAATLTPTPDLWDNNERIAEGYFDTGQYERAIQYYSRAIDENGSSATLYFKRALAYWRWAGGAAHSDQMDTAMDDLNSALLLDSGLADAYWLRGLIYYAWWLENPDPTFRSLALANVRHYFDVAESEIDVDVIEAILRLGS